MGSSIGLNSDGTIVATRSGSGPVRVMEFNNTASHTEDRMENDDSSRFNGGAAQGDWVQLGRDTDIIPDLRYNTYVSSNERGNIIAIGKGPPKLQNQFVFFAAARTVR